MEVHIHIYIYIQLSKYGGEQITVGNDDDQQKMLGVAFISPDSHFSAGK